MFNLLSYFTRPDKLYIDKFDGTFWTVAEVDKFHDLPFDEIMTTWIYQRVIKTKMGLWKRIDVYQSYPLSEHDAARNTFQRV